MYPSVVFRGYICRAYSKDSTCEFGLARVQAIEISIGDGCRKIWRGEDCVSLQAGNDWCCLLRRKERIQLEIYKPVDTRLLQSGNVRWKVQEIEGEKAFIHSFAITTVKGQSKLCTWVIQMVIVDQTKMLPSRYSLMVARNGLPSSSTGVRIIFLCRLSGRKAGELNWKSSEQIVLQ